MDLAKERDKSKDLREEMVQLRTASDACHTQVRTLTDTNDELRAEVNIQEVSISNLKTELKTLREELATREQTLISKVSSLNQCLSALRIQLEESQSKVNSHALMLSQTKEELRVAKENEAMAKERLINSEKECGDKIASILQREIDAIAAATSDLETRLQLAKERARIAEGREESANAGRQKAETECADLRSQAEEQLFRAKEQIKGECDILLQNKDDELSALTQLREADAMQMDDLRQTLANQGNNHKANLENHMDKVRQLSSDLHRAYSDLDVERKASSELSIDLGKTQKRLDAAVRQSQEDKRAWEQETSIKEDEISLLKTELRRQKESHKEQVTECVEKIGQGREREVELERKLVDNEEKHQADREIIMKAAEEAIRNVFM